MGETGLFSITQVKIRQNLARGWYFYLFIIYFLIKLHFVFRPCSWQRDWWIGLSIMRWCSNGFAKRPSWQRRNCSSWRTKRWWRNRSLSSQNGPEMNFRRWRRISERFWRTRRMTSVKPKKEPSWNIVTPMPFYQSSESHIMIDLMMHSVKPRPCIQSLIFHPSISPLRRLRPFIPINQMI